MHEISIIIVLQKSTHGWTTLQVCRSGGWALFWVFLHLTMKERPCDVYSDLRSLKQIVGKLSTMKSSAASKSSPDGTQHSEQHTISP